MISLRPGFSVTRLVIKPLLWSWGVCLLPWHPRMPLKNAPPCLASNRFCWPTLRWFEHFWTTTQGHLLFFRPGPPFSLYISKSENAARISFAGKNNWWLKCGQIPESILKSLRDPKLKEGWGLRFFFLTFSDREKFSVYPSDCFSKRLVGDI